MIEGTGYSVTCVKHADLSALAEKMFRISQLTWQELRQAGRHALGFELMEQSSIDAPLPKGLTPDQKLHVFRYNGLAPMIGIREGRVLHILLLDHDFSAYKHE